MGLDKEALDEIEDLTTEDIESLKEQFDPEVCLMFQLILVLFDF